MTPKSFANRLWDKTRDKEEEQFKEIIEEEVKKFMSSIYQDEIRYHKERTVILQGDEDMAEDVSRGMKIAGITK
jgi:glutamyl-tRNA reductase